MPWETPMHSQLQWTFTTQVTTHNGLEELLLLEKESLEEQRLEPWHSDFVIMLLLREQ